jgi:hypothetical protein
VVALGLAGVVVITALFLGAWRRTAAEMNQEVGSSATISTPSSLSQLLEAHADLPGQVVFLNDVRYEPGPKTDVFFVVGSNGTRLLATGGAQAQINPGALVDVRGVMRRVPPMRTLRNEWKLSASDARLVAEQRVYLEADTVHPQHHAKVTQAS